MKAESNPIREIMDRFDDRVRREAAARFGMDGDALEELEGSAFVFKGERRCGGGREQAVLKITPGLRDPGPIMGASRAELEAEVDYVRYLADNLAPGARSLPSLPGADVEDIPLDGDSSFLAYCFEFCEGSMFPDDDLTVFPPGVLREWSRLLGMTHRLAPDFRPRPGTNRPDWRGDDHLRSRLFIPTSQEAVHRRFEEILALLETLPANPDGSRWTWPRLSSTVCPCPGPRPPSAAIMPLTGFPERSRATGRSGRTRRPCSETCPCSCT